MAILVAAGLVRKVWGANLGDREGLVKKGGLCNVGLVPGAWDRGLPRVSLVVLSLIADSLTVSLAPSPSQHSKNSQSGCIR